MIPTPENIALIRNAFAVEGERRTREAATSHAAMAQEIVDLRDAIETARQHVDAGNHATARAVLTAALGGR